MISQIVHDYTSDFVPSIYSYKCWWPWPYFKITALLQVWNWTYFLSQFVKFKFCIVSTYLDQITKVMLFVSFGMHLSEIIDAVLF